MWKWIAAVVAVVILALVGTCYAGYRKLTTTGDTVAQTMIGSPARVFIMLTDRDSIATWLPVGAELTPNDHGVVHVGDTIRISTPRAPGDPNKQQRQVWVVREIVEPVTLVIEGIEYSPAGVPHVGLARRDSLAPLGDSTTIVSTFEVFPTVINGEASGRMAAATLRAADQLRLGAAKAQWRVQLRRLAAHLGKP